ncbi:hypothetical protein RAF29_21130 [Klebsiella pneumoniae]|uniref:hypothetical protein n=1 Tax=Klebsiella pneumoniae TaxID=573 RepID=UPI001D0EE45D|nr:hypothetical protein [Klebsiella pneumoniae]
MTSKLARERLEKIKSWRETYGAGINVMLPAEEAEELACIALAAMDSEPVAWTDEQELRDVDRGGCGYLFTVNPVTPHADERRIILLYRHAQPAPVVPDGYVMVPEEPTESMVIAGFESEPDEFFSESEVWEAYQKMSGCKQAAFRARLCWRAMLAAAPQEDINALIPLVSRNGQGGDRWIPVSEQKPDCWCRTCRPVDLNDMRFVVCPDCGNKRCPRANDHRNACTGSNEPGQEGSAYPDTLREVK